VLAAAHHLGVRAGSISRSERRHRQADAASLPDLCHPRRDVVTWVPSYDVTWPRDTPVARAAWPRRPLPRSRLGHDRGLDGTGIRAAVIDSGTIPTSISAALTAAAYTSATRPAGTGRPGQGQPQRGAGRHVHHPVRPRCPRSSAASTSWGGAPNGAVVRPEPDRLPGHGTHVADILSGHSADGTTGAWPWSQLYAYKACSAVTTSCTAPPCSRPSTGPST
jgi:hypothetical protein